MPEANQKKRQELDPVFKQLVVLLSERHHFPLETQVEVGRLPRTIDVVIRLGSRDEIERVSKETAFIELRPNNQIEFKSKKESLGVKDYQYIRARTYLYMADHELSAIDMSVTIVCSQTPHKLLFHSQDDVFFEEITPGYYRSKDKPPVILIATNRLPLEEKNYPLILFASHDRKFRAMLQKMALEGNWSYLGLAYRLRPKITEEEISMFQDPYLTEDDLAFIAEDIGPQLLKHFKPEARLAGLKPEEVLAQYKPEARLAGLKPEARLAGLKPEEVLAQYNPEARLAGLKPEARLAGLKPEEVFAHYSLSELEAYVYQRKQIINGQ